MDLSAIFRIRTKKVWWMDVIFYLVVSLLIAAIFCYVIFWVKAGMLSKQVDAEKVKITTQGTLSQKDQETRVIGYQKKIADFTTLLKNHEFASNVFAFVQAQTMPNIWFKQFSLDEKNNGVQLSGEADTLDAFSRQVATFEGNKYVKDIGTLNSSLGASARISFNINLILDQSIFAYLVSVSSASVSGAPAEQPAVQQGQSVPATGTTPANGASVAPTVPATQSGEKLITAFHLKLTPEVIGLVDETNFTVTLNVPYGTDLQNLTPAIDISPGSSVLPASGVSQNFTNAVVYRVTAQDGSVQKYVVTVIPAAPPVASKKSGQVGSSILIIFAVIVIIVVVGAVIMLVLRKKKASQDNL